MPRIAVDLTPLLPGGENGAAKLLVLELLAQFKELVHPYNFLLLTADWNHQELAAFEGPRFQRLCVLPAMNPAIEPVSSSNFNYLNQVVHYLRQALPEKTVFRLLTPARWLRQYWIQQIKPYNDLKVSKDLLAAQGVDLLFCPLTAPTYAEPCIPVVSIFYDLQHCVYPQFFDFQELEGRETTLNLVRQRVGSIICISEYSRQALLAYLKIPPDRTYTVPVCIHTRLSKNRPNKSKLESLKLNDRPYLFYPANFWPHKNHKMLLTAYNILLRRNPDLELDLVFTGALLQPEKELRAAVETMGLKERVHFLGYLSDEELSTVFQGCQFLIFPSLYEGFGVPLLEAFTFGKPVLCSQVGSLPEIGGKGAYYFDPRKPLAIVKAIEQLINDPDQATELVRRGYEQVSKFSEEDMAQRYLEIFGKTLVKAADLKEELNGVFADGWLGRALRINYGAEQTLRVLEMDLLAPEYLPFKKITIRQNPGSTHQKRWKLARGQSLSLRLPLLVNEGHFNLLFSPVFKPNETTNSDDQRDLSCLCLSCRIIYPDGSQKVLFTCP